MKKLFSYITFFLLLAALISVQYFSDLGRKMAPYTEPIVFKPEIVRAADLGLHNAASDLEWLAGVQYLGGAESRRYEKLDDYLFLSADLDTKFAYPYAFGALLLPSFRQVDRGIEIALLGIDRGIEDWRVPYYLAVTYHLNKEDSTSAAKYFDLAANTKGAPDNIKKVAANFGSKSDKRDKTKQIWIGIYETSNDEVVKERAKNYILHFEILDLLENASKQYYKINNKYPAVPDDLVSARILKAIPPDPFGLQLEINQENGSASAK